MICIACNQMAFTESGFYIAYLILIEAGLLEVGNVSLLSLYTEW